MKFAFNTWAYSSFPVWVPAYPLEEVIARLARIGYQGIEIGAANPHAYPRHLPPERRRALRDVLRAHDLQVAAMLPAPGGGQGVNVASSIPAERADAVQYYKEVVDLCAYWGGETVIYVGGWQIFGTTRRDCWGRSLESLVEVARHAAAAGVTIAVEPTPADSNLIESADDALELQRQAGLDNVKVMFDTFHAIYRNEPAADYVYRMGADLAHVHLSDNDRLPPGAGQTDFRPLLAALRDQGYTGWLSMEIAFDRRSVDPDAAAWQALEHLRGLGDS
jgi:protein FrlC